MVTGDRVTGAVLLANLASVYYRVPEYVDSREPAAE